MAILKALCGRVRHWCQKRSPSLKKVLSCHPRLKSQKFLHLLQRLPLRQKRLQQRQNVLLPPLRHLKPKRLHAHLHARKPLRQPKPLLRGAQALKRHAIPRQHLWRHANQAARP
jgi:hypothetical protein